MPGRCRPWNTFIEVHGSPATIDYFGRRLVLCGRRSTWSTSGSFCVAGAALGAPQAGFAWHVQHLGRTSGSFCVAGAVVEASQLRIAGHFFRAQTIHTTPSTLHHQTHHHQDNTISTTSSTQSHQHNLINTSPSAQHHLHNTIYTTSSTTPSTHPIYVTSSTQHHQHNFINTSPSTKHHLHNTINTTPSTLHHQTLARAALGALPYCPFCLIPADTPFVFLRCGLFFVLFR